MDANPQAPHRIRVRGGQPVSSSFRPGESSLRYEAKPYGPAEGPGAGLSNCWASGICSIARPAGLSGGERQRAGIARALALGPQLLLMDEPLSALDYRRRQEILPYLERLRAELAIPRIYVSHAPEEVARLADHLIVVDDGRVQASGSLSESLLLARMTRRAAALLGIAPGKLFWVQVKSVMLLH